MLRWHLTDYWLTVLNQPLADQDLSGFPLDLIPSLIDWISLSTPKHLNNLSKTETFANGLFLLEQEQDFDWISSFNPIEIPVGQNIAQKF